MEVRALQGRITPACFFFLRCILIEIWLKGESSILCAYTCVCGCCVLHISLRLIYIFNLFLIQCTLSILRPLSMDWACIWNVISNDTVRMALRKGRWTMTERCEVVCPHYMFFFLFVYVQNSP